MSKPVLPYSSPTLRAVPNEGPWITLISGGKFHFLWPGQSDFTIEDIAHALSHLCRYNGHCSHFYSVAEHSYWCSQIVEHILGEDRGEVVVGGRGDGGRYLANLQLAALLHDAAEAFLGDVCSPLKKILPDYRALEESVEAAVFARLRVGYPLDPLVKEADRRMARTEVQQLMAWDWMKDWGVKAAAIRVEGWSPEGAKNAFLCRYKELNRILDGIE